MTTKPRHARTKTGLARPRPPAGPWRAASVKTSLGASGGLWHKRVGSGPAHRLQVAMAGRSPVPHANLPPAPGMLFA
ncbi:hypothetical protein RA210_U100026 [Rubrivivax sp. A210]|nr:hypothetical protein RA210_U100026 [Rubrivivax sp. A210]